MVVGGHDMVHFLFFERIHRATRAKWPPRNVVSFMRISQC